MKNKQRILSKFAVEIFLIFLALSLFFGCEEAEHFTQLPDPRPIEAMVKTAVPLARVAAMATIAIDGNNVANTVVNGSCAVYPCATTVDVQLLDGLFPIHQQAPGMALVAGYWSSAQSGVLIVTFIDVSVGILGFSISKISTFPITRTANGVRIVYAELDLDINTDPTDPASLTNTEIQSELDRLSQTKSTDPIVALEMGAWIVDVDFQGSLTKF